MSVTDSDQYERQLRHLMVERGKNPFGGTLGSSIPCEFSKPFAKENGISAYGRMEVKEGVRRYYAGPSTYEDSRQVVPKPAFRDIFSNMEAMRDGGATHYVEFLREDRALRVYPDEVDSLIVKSYEQALVAKLKESVVLVDPSMGSLYRFAVLKPMVHFTSANNTHADSIRAEMRKFSPPLAETSRFMDCLYYFGTNGKPKFRPRKFLSFGPNPSLSRGFFERSSVVEGVTSTAVTYERSTALKEVVYKLDETEKTFNPSRVDMFLDLKHRAFFCWTSQHSLFDLRAEPSHQGRRFYYPPPPATWKEVQTPSMEVKSWLVLADACSLWDALPVGYIVGTWCSRSLDRSVLANHMGLFPIKPIEYGEYYVTYESDYLMRDPTVSFVDGVFTMMSSHEFPCGGVIDSLSIPVLATWDPHSAYAWRAHDLTGISTPGLPEGSGFHLPTYFLGGVRVVAVPHSWYIQPLHVWVFGSSVFFEANTTYISSYVAGQEGRLTSLPLSRSKMDEEEDPMIEMAVEKAPISVATLSLSFPTRPPEGIFESCIREQRLFLSTPYMSYTPGQDSKASPVFDILPHLKPPCSDYHLLHRKLKLYKYVYVISEERLPSSFVVFLQQQASLVFPTWSKGDKFVTVVVSQRGDSFGITDFVYDKGKPLDKPPDPTPLLDYG